MPEKQDVQLWACLSLPYSLSEWFAPNYTLTTETELALAFHDQSPISLITRELRAINNKHQHLELLRYADGLSVLILKLDVDVYSDVIPLKAKV